MTTQKPNIWIVGDNFDMPETAIYSELPKLGINLYTIYAPTMREDLKQILKNVSVATFEIPIKNRLDFAASRAIRKELQKHPCDAIYCTVNKPLAAVLRAVRPLKHIKVLAYRGTCGHLSRLDPSNYLTYFHPRLNHIVAVSDAVKKYLVEQCHFKDQSVTRIYKGHNPTWYAPGKETLRTSPGLDIGFIGQIRHVKGVEYLLDALKLIPQNLNITLTLIGGISDNYLKKRIAYDTQNDPRIRYLGFRTDATKLVSTLDVTIMPTIEREGLAKAVIESLAQGVPTIVTNVGGLPEIVEDGISGIIVPPCNPQAIAKAIITLATDPQKLAQMSQNARTRIQTHFNYKDSANAFAKLFTEITK